MIVKNDYQKLARLARNDRGNLLHIHLDFKSEPMAEEIAFLASRGINPTPFIAHPHLRPERPSFEPIDPTGRGIPFHFTKISSDAREIHRDVLDIDEQFLSKTSSQLYLEVELVLSLGSTAGIYSTNMDGVLVRAPIHHIETELITEGSGIWFRDSELHVYANRTLADSTEIGRRAIEAIANLGLYEAYYDGKYYGMKGVGAVFTVQGTRDIISEIGKRILPFLNSLKNLTEAVVGIEREDIIGYCLVNMGPSQLPPLAKSVF